MNNSNKPFLAGAVLCVFAPVSALASPTITNSSFEAVQITTPFSSNPADIPGWTHSGNVGDALIWNATFPQCCGGTGTAKAGDGNQFVTMGGGFGPTGSSAWSQTINGLTVGQTYVVRFMMAAEGETPTQQMTVDMTSGSSTAAETFTSPVTNSLFWQNWGIDQYSFLATGTSGTLQFSVTDQAWDVGLDGVSIAAADGRTSVPEPATLGLMGLGLAGIGLARRKRSS